MYATYMIKEKKLYGILFIFLKYFFSKETNYNIKILIEI